MKVTVHQPVEGKNSGETVTVDADHGQWLITNGYASASGDATPDTSAEKAEAAPAPKRKRK